MTDTLLLLRLVAWGAHHPNSVIRYCPACTASLVLSYGGTGSEQHQRLRYTESARAVTWYCYSCRLTITMQTSQEGTGAEAEPMEGGDSRHSSPALKRASRVFEEEYMAWENKVNSEFVEFLAHIREWVSGKEGTLKEQQLDLCHRERSLQSNEDFFKERMATLKTAEEEFQQKVERLNLQIQDRMQRLRTLEAHRKRASVSYADMGTQTDPSGSRGAALRLQAPAEQSQSAPIEGDYMFMGEGRRYEKNSAPPDTPVIVDTQLPVNDSGFNTPDPDEVSPGYTYTAEAESSGVTRQPSQNGLSQPGARLSSSSLHYNGERAILVKSPPGLDAYTGRSESYRNAMTRSRSVPPEEQKQARDRSLSPVASRSRSVPPEHDPIKRVQATFSDNILDRPASFAEGQRSPEALRSRSGSFGAQSVNGHASRNSHKPLPARARFMRSPRQSDQSPPGSSAHARSLSAGNEPISEDIKDEPLPNSVPDYNPDTLPTTGQRPLGSNSVTNLDDPRLRESILTKSKQSSFNMNDAIARYRAKSENQPPHDLSGSSASSPHDGANWQSDSAVAYRPNSYAPNQTQSHPHDSTGQYSTNVPTTQPYMELNHNGTGHDYAPKQGKTRIPGRRSDPPDFRNRPNKLTPAYPHSDSNILNTDTKSAHDINSNTLRPSATDYASKQQSRLTSPKPILKNPLKPVDTYHNTFTNSSYMQSRIQQPSTKSYRRFDPPAPVRRYPSDGEGIRRLPSEGEGGKDHTSMKSSSSDLYNHHANGYQGDSASSHGSGQHTAYPHSHSAKPAHSVTRTDSNFGAAPHMAERNGGVEVPEMTSTPRETPSENLMNPPDFASHTHADYPSVSRGHTDYTSQPPAGSNHVRVDYKQMSSFKGVTGSVTGSNTGSRLASPSLQYRESSSQLQHPVMAGKISLRDKSTWAIKRRREHGKPPEGSANTTNTATTTTTTGTAERPSRRLPQPGVYGKSSKDTGRTRSDPRTEPQYDPRATRDVTSHAPHSPTPHVHRPQHSPAAAQSPASRRARSSEAYLESRKPFREQNGYQHPPPYRAPRPPSYPPRQSHHDNEEATPPRHTDNDVLERASDSDSELTAPKHSKKKGFKSKLRGLYKNSASKSAGKSSSEGRSTQLGSQGKQAAHLQNSSPKTRRKLPTYNSQERFAAH